MLRIIGGTWRGRKLNFPDVDGLRPTSDRTRETVFNWLQPVISGSRCLDLFAGSGALGFEAASRGAASVILVETNQQAVTQLKQHQSLLSAPQIEVVHSTAESFLTKTTTSFDVVFMDPPFEVRSWAATAQQLTQKNLLRSGSRIYVEYPRKQTPPELPDNWHLLREKHAGDVTYCLFEFQTGTSA